MRTSVVYLAYISTHVMLAIGLLVCRPCEVVFTRFVVLDLLITESGDKVAPKQIEDAVMSKLPCVSHCILVGEGRRYVSLLLTLKVNNDRFNAMCRGLYILHRLVM